jgi:alpha-1,6-mannosyltransferase
MRLAAIGIATLASSLVWSAVHARFGFQAFSTVYGVQFLLYVLALLSVARQAGEKPWSARRELAVILGVALALRVVLVWQAPVLSDDVYRYVWDGKVQAAGINPYRFIPEDPRLASLRDAEVFPYINRRAYAPTIYPPGAQIAFLLAHFIGGETVLGIKLAMVGCDLATVGMLVVLLRRLGEDARRVVVYAWHPLVCWEVAQSGHIDAAAIALTVGAVLAANRSRRALSGALLGAAALVKGYPLLLAPAFARRGGVRFVAALAATFLLYVPYAGVGWRVLGFLPTYVHEEGIDTGDRFVLLRLARLAVPFPTWLYVGLVALAFAAVSVRAMRRSAPDTRLEARDAATLAAMALALGTPHYAWYALWLIALVTVAPRPAWLYLASASALLYYAPRAYGARLVFDAVQFVPLLALLAVEASRKAARTPLTAGDVSGGC